MAEPAAPAKQIEIKAAEEVYWTLSAAVAPTHSVLLEQTPGP